MDGQARDRELAFHKSPIYKDDLKNRIKILPNLVHLNVNI